MTKASEQKEAPEPTDAPATKDTTRPEDPVPLGGNEPGVLPPSTAGTSHAAPDK